MKDPLIVEVETADGRTRKVVLTGGIEEKHFFGIDDDICYYFDSMEASHPKHLIGMSVFGIPDEKGDIIIKVKRVFDYETQKQIKTDLKI